MKEKLFTIISVVVLFLASFGIITYIMVDNNYYTEEAKTLEKFVGVLKNNISNNKQRGFYVKFDQKYSLESIEQNDIEDVDFRIDYSGNGEFKLSYTLDDENQKVSSILDVYDLISKTDGYMQGNQYEKVSYYNEETLKSTQETDVEEFEYETFNKFTFKSDNTNLFITSDNKYVDLMDSSNDKEAVFNAKISNQAILNTISKKNLNQSIDDIMFMDVWDYIESITKYVNDKFSKLTFHNGKDIRNFIKKNNFNFKEEEKNIVVSFSLNLTEAIDSIDIKVPKLDIVLNVDKENGDITNFQFELKDFFYTILDAGKEGKETYNTVVDTFKIEGMILSTKLNDVSFDCTFEEYNEENIDQFIDNYETKVHLFNHFAS